MNVFVHVTKALVNMQVKFLCTMPGISMAECQDGADCVTCLPNNLLPQHNNWQCEVPCLPPYLMVRATMDSSTGPRPSCSKWISSMISRRTRLAYVRSSDLRVMMSLHGLQTALLFSARLCQTTLGTNQPVLQQLVFAYS